MVIFHSYVSLPQGIWLNYSDRMFFFRTIDDGFPWIGEIIPFNEAESDLDLRMGE